MGLFGRRKNKTSTENKQEASSPPKEDEVLNTSVSKGDVSKSSKVEAGPSLANETNCFEFGAGADTEDSLVLAGYCPVSDELEPCRWRILQPWSAQAPKFRIMF